MPEHGKKSSRASRASSSTGSSSSTFSPVAGFYGADAETSRDVVMLINDVRQIGGVEIYRPFIRLLKDTQSQKITRQKLILCVHDLLKGHPFLLQRFCKLVPPQAEDEREPRRVRRIEEKEEYRSSKASLDREVCIAVDLKCKPAAAQHAPQPPPPAKAGAERAPSGGFKRWPGTRKVHLEVSHAPPAGGSGRSWMKPWALAQHWLCSNRVSDDAALPQEAV